MIALVLIYWVGKAFYNLAGNHQKSEWGFAILGVVSYYAGLFCAAFLIGIFMIIALETTEFDSRTEMAVSLCSIPFGVLACWGFYKLLERQWGKPVATINEEVLDGDLLNNQ